MVILWGCAGEGALSERPRGPPPAYPPGQRGASHLWDASRLCQLGSPGKVETSLPASCPDAGGSRELKTVNCPQ